MDTLEAFHGLDFIEEWMKINAGIWSSQNFQAKKRLIQRIPILINCRKRQK